MCAAESMCTWYSVLRLQSNNIATSERVLHGCPELHWPLNQHAPMCVHTGTRVLSLSMDVAWPWFAVLWAVHVGSDGFVSCSMTKHRIVHCVMS